MQIGVPTLAIFSALGRSAIKISVPFSGFNLSRWVKIRHYESIKIHLWPCDSGPFGLTCESKAWKTVVIQKMKCVILSWNVH
jgi:hypothetical protein